jgi:hypothetical protein
MIRAVKAMGEVLAERVEKWAITSPKTLLNVDCSIRTRVAAVGDNQSDGSVAV